MDLPHSEEAENAVLGAIIRDNNLAYQVVDKLTPADFYTKDNTVIYKVIQDMIYNNEKVDAVTLWDKLDNSKIKGGIGYISKLMEGAPSLSRVKYYAGIVKEKSKLRSYLRLSLSITDMIQDGANTKDITEHIEETVMKVMYDVNEKGVVHIKSAVSEFKEMIQKGYDNEGKPGISTGIDFIDNITGGLRPGQLSILAARPSMGKSALAGNIMWNIANAGGRVVNFSIEMTITSHICRFTAYHTDINSSRIRDGRLSLEEKKQIEEWTDIFNGLELYIDETAKISVQDIRLRVKRANIQHGKIDLIIIDHLQILNVVGKYNTRNDALAEISKTLKAIGKEFGVPVLVVSQLSRQVEKRDNKQPILSDLRESGAIEQDADLVLTMYRPEYYDKSKEPGICYLNCVKNRDGMTGETKLIFDPEVLRFRKLKTHKQVMEYDHGTEYIEKSVVDF